MSQVVARHVPYLRRYARALTGSQSAGDAYVAATLEALIEDPAVLSGGTSLRVALYRAFSRIWSSVPVNGETEPVDTRGRVEQRLTHITPPRGRRSCWSRSKAFPSRRPRRFSAST